jgi:actin-related protein
VTPVLDSKILQHASVTIPMGGRDVDAYLGRLLAQHPAFQDLADGQAPEPALLTACKETMQPDRVTYKGRAVPRCCC